MSTGDLFEGSFVQNGVVQIPKFDANPNLILTLTYAYMFRTNDPSDN